MYKTELVRRVAREERLSKRVVNDALTTALKVIQQTLADGRTVTLPGFGTFYTSKKAAGKVKHIQTGKDLSYPARRRAAFRAGELLKQAVRRKK